MTDEFNNTTRVRIWLWLIRFVGVIVPRRLRADWRQEWEAELRNREETLAIWKRLDWRLKLGLIRRSLGAFADALWLQQRRLEEDFFQDLRYGVRMLSKHRGFTLSALITLSLGIGANAAIFSLVNGVLLRPLPFKEPDRLVMVWERRLTSGDANLPVAAYEYREWLEDSHLFDGMALIQPATVNLLSPAPGLISTWRVSSNFFDVLGVEPLLGRTFADGPDTGIDRNIVVLNQKLWLLRFGSSSDVLGRTITLDDRPYTVVGVVQDLDLIPDAFVPLDVRREEQKTGDDGHEGYNVIGRLRPAISIDQAQTDLALVASRLEQQDPANNAGHEVRILSLGENAVGNIRGALLILLGAVAFVLLIACVNVSNLLMGRAASRQKEVAIRRALGATRVRLVRQLLTESLILGIAGGASGLILAYWLTNLLRQITAVRIPRIEHISVDGRVLAATICFSLLTGLLTGIVPALRSCKSSLAGGISEGTRASASPARRRGGNLLVILEVSLTTVLLIGSGLMIKSFSRLISVDPGFKPSNVLRVDLALPEARYQTRESSVLFYDELMRRLRSVPGVLSVTAASQTPLRSNGNWDLFSIEHLAAPPPSEKVYVAVCSVSTDYFGALSIPLKLGRDFTDFDAQQSEPVVIINETVARRFWPEEDPIGKRVRLGSGPWRAIVGVVGDVRHNGLNSQPNPEVFLPFHQEPAASLAVMVRTSGNPSMLVSAIREEVAKLDHDLPAPIDTMDQIFAQSVAGLQFNTLLLSAFAGLALCLAIVGVFGVANNSVAQRTNEFGIRMALGAQRRNILALVLGEGLVVVAAGVGMGLAGGYVLTRVVSDLLYEVSPTDAGVFAMSSVVLAVVALAACLTPARRAMNVDPITALRYE